MNLKKFFIAGALLSVLLPVADAQARGPDMFKRKFTVRPGATVVLAQSGQASERCATFTAPTLDTQKAPSLGRISSEEYTKTVQPGSRDSLACDGKPRQMTRVKYTAGKTSGTDTLQFSLTNPGRTYIYQVTVDVK